MVPLMIMTLLSAAMPGDEQDAEAGVGGWRLANSPSAYLREHSENPVEWHPWGDAAFEEARKLDRPVFLSIGYSSCHWCHVMRRESFSDEAIAAYLNANFISIKVDREDLPHVDEVYMDAVRAMTGGGGWPLSVFLFPDGKPFYGGTYFPPRQRFNRPGFLEISGSIIKAWNTDRGKMRESATGLLDHLSKRDQRQHEGQSMELFLG
ncbi:MAG: thioredoxin domain-containing protein, partial [Planctomycetota bacterium]|nr:thioredoxin domain-containing protein [Planctomycetota bacterium]